MESVGMDECDFQTVEPAPRRLVDQLRAGCGELAQRRRHVVGLESDVMHPRATLGEEARDRRVAAGRGKELDATRADEERCRLDPLLGKRVAELDAGVEEPLVGGDRLVEVRDGHAHMVNPAQVHASDATRVRLRA